MAKTYELTGSSNWFLVSLAAAGTVGLCTMLLLILPFGWATAGILAFLIALIWVLFHNPRYWYRRAARALISVLVALPIIETFSFQLDFDSVFMVWNTGTSIFFYVIIGSLVAYLLSLDFQLNQKHIRNMVAAVERAEQVDDETEQLKIIETVAKSKRDKLVMQALQAKTGFFGADTDSLPPEEKGVIILKQIELSEKRMLAQHRLSMTIIVIVAFWIIGISAVVSYKLVAPT